MALSSWTLMDKIVVLVSFRGSLGNATTSCNIVSAFSVCPEASSPTKSGVSISDIALHGRFHGCIATLKNWTQRIIISCLNLVLRLGSEQEAETKGQEHNDYYSHFSSPFSVHDYPLIGRLVAYAVSPASTLVSLCASAISDGACCTWASAGNKSL